MMERRCHVASAMRSAGNLQKAMSNIWKICAVAILITGSISSTSGATACTESIPIGPITLSLPGDPETGDVAYREEVRHPALPFPKVATGTLGVNASGKLIRHQKTPDVEIVEIGEDVLQVRKGEDGEPNMLPVPSDMKGIFGFLRAMASAPERTIQQTTETLRTCNTSSPISTISTSGVF